MSRGKLAASVLIPALALAGCGPLDQDYTEERTESATVSEIVLDSGRGSVVIEPGTDSTVHIRRHVSYSGPRPKQRDRLDGAVLRLDTHCEEDCRVNYRIRVPTAVKVSGSQDSGAITLRKVGAVSVRTGSGAIRIEGARGAVGVHTDSGAVHVADVEGNVTATTGSGAMRIDRVTGVVVAESSSGALSVRETTGNHLTLRTSSGAITVKMGKAQTVRAVADSGAIQVTVPTDAQFDVNARSDSGHHSIGVPDVPGAPHRLDLETDSGGITVNT